MKQDTLFIFFLFYLCLCLSGCATIQFQNSTEVEQQTHQHWHHVALWGNWEVSEPIQVSSYCATGKANLDSRIGPWGLVLTVISVGIYTPYQVTLHCQKSKN